MKWGMNGLGLLMMLTLISAARSEPSGLLNDTGQTLCLNAAGNAMASCSVANSDDTSPYPRQDGRFGRDAAELVGRLVKIGGGDGGFD